MEADTCPECRRPLSESTHPDAEGGYTVPPPTRCHACTALHIHQQRHIDAKPGLMFQVEPRKPGRG